MAGEAVRAALNHIWNSLEPLGQPLALMGGMALAVWNYPRATRNIDVLISMEGTNVDAVLKVLQAHGCRPKRTPPVVKIGALHMLQLLYTPPDEFYDVQFDLLLAESPLEKSAIARRVTREVPGMSRPIEVLQCDDLILLKLVSGRIVDRADAAMLLRENCAVIDYANLQNWASNLDLKGDLSAIWQEACPGEPSPFVT